MSWTTVSLEVTTPLFNGGASSGLAQDEEAGVRAASVRGVMRFWFRAMAGAMTGTDLQLLAALERRVFGGISAGDAASSSPLILRIPAPPRASRSIDLPRDRADAGPIGYLMGLGLMKPGPGGIPALERPCVAPGTPFDLKLRFQHGVGDSAEIREAVEALAFVSLWLACAYGGFGARTRRGFGGVRIASVTGDLPPGWRPEWLRTPSLGVYASDRRPWPWPPAVFGIYERHLPALIKAESGRPAGPRDIWTEEPPFPVLSTAYSPAALSAERFGSWQETLTYAGTQLRLFRANRPDRLAARQEGPVKTAEWDEAIRGHGTDFPLGALGLPVGFRDKIRRHGFVVNAASPNGQEMEELRRASPLWLRPVGSGQSWRLLSIAFLTRFLPGNAQVRVVPDKNARQAGNRTRTVFVEQDDVDSLTGQWLATLADGGDFATVIRT
jgi:hypothetical protein